MYKPSATGSSSWSVFLQESWYGAAAWLYILRPLSGLFRLLIAARRACYRQQGPNPSVQVPVIVIGNICVGGTGKTPLLMALAEELKRRGHRVGIVSRGYGGDAKHFPLRVERDTDPARCGDEPAMMARRLGIPVMVDPIRRRAVAALVNMQDYRCDVILSDDGLQHYAMSRDMEIVVVDAERGFGNGWCLPAGPLREPLSRLASVDFRVCNGEDRAGKLPGEYRFVTMTLQPTACVHVVTGERVGVETFFRRQPVHGVAGIGNPSRFFHTLKALGAQVIAHPFPDHHVYAPQDLHFGDALPVLMTEKDAVKCRHIPLRDAWYLEVSAVLPDAFYEAVVNRLSSLQVARKINLQRGLPDGSSP